METKTVFLSFGEQFLSLTEEDSLIKTRYIVPEGVSAIINVSSLILATAQKAVSCHVQWILEKNASLDFHWAEAEQDSSKHTIEYHFSFELGYQSILNMTRLHAPLNKIMFYEDYFLGEKSHLISYLWLFQSEPYSLFYYYPSVIHQGMSSQSDVQVRALLAGAVEAQLCAKMKLLPGVSGSAHYHNHNLMVYGSPSLVARPDLEVDFDQVQCSHAVTMGQQDTQALFYLQSRGLSEAMAHELLLQAFVWKDRETILKQYSQVVDSYVNSFLQPRIRYDS